MYPSKTLLLVLWLTSAACFAPERGDDGCAVFDCESWQTCVAGVCATRAGFCAGYADCAADASCGADHVCHGPAYPAASFFEPLVGSSARFELRALINTETALDPTPGTGTIDVLLDELETHMQDLPYVSSHTFADDDPEPDRQGRDFLLVREYAELSHNDANAQHYLMLSAGLPVDWLRELRDGGQTEAPYHDAMWFALYRVELRQRSWDGMQLSRYCPSAWAPSTPDSRLFVNHVENTRFAAGEILQIWGNLALTDVQMDDVEQEQSLCVYYQENLVVTRQQYLDALAAEPPSLSCGLPDDFYGGTSGDRLDLLLMGRVTDMEQSERPPPYGHATTFLEGVTEDVSRYLMVGYLYTLDEQEMLVVQSQGLPTYGTDRRYLYELMTVTINRSHLAANCPDRGCEIAINSDNSGVTIEHCEWTSDDAHSYLKTCPRAVLRPSSTASRALLCGGETELRVGAELHLAASFELATDPVTLRAAYGTTDCWCAMDSLSQIVSCDVFEAVAAQSE